MIMFDASISAKVIRNLDPDIVETSGRSSNDAFPCRLWQSFSLAGWDFSVDWSIDCKKIVGGFELSSDIATSEGLILAEYETISISESLGVDEKESLIKSWMQGLQNFLQNNAKTITEKLASAKNRSQI